MARRKILTDEEVRRALENSDDENYVFRESDSEDEDFVADSDSDSEGNLTEIASEADDEQLCSDSENTIEEEELNNSIIEYVGKDGTKWKAEPEKARRTPRHNIIRGGIHKVVLPPGKVIHDPIDSFNLFFNQNTLELIANHTNSEAKRILQNKWKPMDIIELQAFVGLLLAIGVNKQSDVDFREYWDPIFGNPVFRATMGKNRFAAIQRFLRFDDKVTRTLRKSKDKLAPIRELWEDINHKLQKFYLPGENLTIDEQLIPFRGRVSFKQYLPSKPDKYGMKMWWICDSETSYPSSGIPYLGRDGPNRTNNLAYMVVNKLCEPFYGTNRNITVDNYFMSFEVANFLLQNGLTIVGTIKKNKRCIPKNFQPCRKRNIESNIFGFCKKMTLVSYVPKKNRAVIFLSTMHHTKEIDIENKNKSEINLYYNATKGGVDTLDQMAHEYTVRRKTNRWPVAFFQNIIDIVGVASLIIWKNLYPNWNERKKCSKRKIFLREIVTQLVTPHVQRRGKKGLTKYHVEAMEDVAGSSKEASIQPADKPVVKRRKRCHICPSAISRISKQCCDKCSLNVCSEHSIKKIICVNCK